MNFSDNKRLSLTTLYFFILLSFLLQYSYGQDKDTAEIDTVSLTTDTLTISERIDSASADTVTDTISVQRIKDTVRYEADIIEYDIDRKIILLRGNGVVRYHKMTLYADTIHFLYAENMLVATGYPQLIEGNDTVVGDNMVYNLKTGRGKVRYGTAHSEDSKYDGLRISRSDDKSFYITDGSYTSCAVDDSSHYYFYGKHIKVSPEDKAISRPIVLNIGGAPVMALPYYITPLEKGRRSGWLRPRWGGHVTHGGHLDNIGYYWVPNDYTDFRVAGKITEFASYLLQTKARYALRYWLSGSISGRYSMSTSHDTLNNLWALDYTHNQNILPDESMKLTGRGNIVSGKSFYKSTSEDTTELINQQINANMSLTKNFKKINAYGNINWHRNHNFKTNMVDQNLPSFAFNLNTRPLIPYKEDENASVDEEDKEKWYNKISYSYKMNGNRKYSYNTDVGKENSLFDHSGLGQDIQVSAPQTIFKWFSLTPRFSLHHAVFDAYFDTTIKEMNINDSIIYDTLNEHPNVFVSDTIVINDDTLYTIPTDTISDTSYEYKEIDFNDPSYSFRKANTYSWNTGVSLSTKLYGVFPIKIFNFQGIRHTFTPSVSYTLLPKKDLDRRFPDVGVSYNGPRERGQVVGFSFDNLFQGKALSYRVKNKNEPEEKKFTIISGGIGASYDFEAKTRKWSDIGVSARIPNNIIDFSYSSSFTPYDDENKLIFPPKLMKYTIRLSPKFRGASGSLWGGDFLTLEGLQPEDYMKGYADLKTPGWNISFNPSYSFTKSRTSPSEKVFKTTREYHLNTSARIKFTNIWSASWGSKYDFTKNQFVNHSVNFHCDLECWDLKFDWYPSGFNQGYYYFIIRIKKHPEIKYPIRS